MSIDNKSAYDSNIYDEHIVNVLPYYREYHDQIIDLVQICKQDPIDWLDTGCGTGTLASRVLEKEQNVRFTLCDPSEKMLNEAEKKLKDKNIRMSSETSDTIAMKRWVKFLREHGNSEQDIKMHIDRRGVETFPITIEQHIDLLRRSGFRSVDILWASYLQAGFLAIK